MLLLSVPLRIMQAMTKRYTYNELNARKFLPDEDQDWRQEFENKIDNYLTSLGLGSVAFYDWYYTSETYSRRVVLWSVKTDPA